MIRIGKLAFAFAFIGTTVLTGLTFAAAPTTQAVVDTAEVQHLRATRKELNEAKNTFDKDPADSANHRKEILEGIDKALVAVDAEIDELLKK